MSGASKRAGSRISPGAPGVCVLPAPGAYIGQTAGLEQQLVEHASGAGGWSEGGGRGPSALVQTERFEWRAAAAAADERAVKGVPMLASAE